jgi:hypothetical protein
LDSCFGFLKGFGLIACDGSTSDTNVERQALLVNGVTALFYAYGIYLAAPGGVEEEQRPFVVLFRVGL